MSLSDLVFSDGSIPKLSKVHNFQAQLNGCTVFVKSFDLHQTSQQKTFLRELAVYDQYQSLFRPELLACFIENVNGHSFGVLVLEHFQHSILDAVVIDPSKRNP